MRALSCLCLALSATACSPTFDWREVRPAGTGAQALFPCRPDSQARQVRLAAIEVRLELHACSAGDATWALATADVGDPGLVGTALAELGAAATSNLGASGVRELELVVAGATPNPQARCLRFEGRLPDGRPVSEQVAVFAKGTRVFQATVLGARLQPDAVQSFFSGLRLP